MTYIYYNTFDAMLRAWLMRQRNPWEMFIFFLFTLLFMFARGNVIEITLNPLSTINPIFDGSRARARARVLLRVGPRRIFSTAWTTRRLLESFLRISKFVNSNKASVCNAGAINNVNKKITLTSSMLEGSTKQELVVVPGVLFPPNYEREFPTRKYTCR